MHNMKRRITKYRWSQKRTKKGSGKKLKAAWGPCLWNKTGIGVGETEERQEAKKGEQSSKTQELRTYNWNHWTVERTRHLKQNHMKKKYSLTLSIKYVFIQYYCQDFIFNRKENCVAFYKLKQPSFHLIRILIWCILRLKTAANIDNH